MEINNQSLQAVRELNETGGSNIRTVEKFISSTYDVEAEQVSQCDGHMDIFRILSLAKDITISSCRFLGFSCLQIESIRNYSILL